MGRELQQCPNPKCHRDVGSLIVERDPLNTRRWYGWVQCGWCGVRGPTGDSDHDARLLWNSAFARLAATQGDDNAE